MRRAARTASLGIAAILVISMITLPAGAKGRTVHITKSDSKGNPVAGATFELFVDAAPVGGGPPKGAEDTKSVGKCTTGANGQCDIAGVPTGDYWVSETGPPAGYSPAEDSRLKVPDRTIVVVTDDRTPKNIRVNSPSMDPGQGDGTHIFQFGPSIAVDPSGIHAVVGFTDTTGAASAPISLTGLATSSNGGASFTDRGEVPVGPSGGIDFGGPSVTYDPVTNRFVMITEHCRQDNTCPLVFRDSSDNGATWSNPIEVYPGMPPSPQFAHSPFVIVDIDENPFTGRIYVLWTMSNGMFSQLFVSYSDDDGATWTTKPFTDQGRFDYPFPAVAPDGTLFVTWATFESGGVEQNQFFFSSSTDGGATFSPPVPITGVMPASGHVTDCNGQQRHVLDGNVASQDPVQLAIDPFDPSHLFAAFGSHGQGTDEADIFLSTSNDGGKTWSSAEPIGPTQGDQFFPSMGVTPDGQVGIFFYDRRLHDPRVDVRGAFFSAFDDRYIGSTILTSRGFAVPSLKPAYDSFLNDCFGLDPFEAAFPGSGFFVPWTDGRDKGPAADKGVDPNIYFARVEAPPLPTTTTLTVDVAAGEIRATGDVAPPPGGGSVTITLFRKVNAVFEKVVSKRPALDTAGHYATTLPHPKAASCRITARFPGDDAHGPSKRTKTFAC